MRRRDLIIEHLHLDVGLSTEVLARQFGLTPRGVRKILARVKTYAGRPAGPEDEG